MVSFIFKLTRLCCGCYKMFPWMSAEMGQLAAEEALKDAGVGYHKVQGVAASYCYGDPTCGECVIY